MTSDLSLSAEMKKQLYEYLAGFATENKRQKIEEVLAYRTRYITVVLEDIYQPQNASAVVRSCDCFGIQDLYVIENRNVFQVKAGVVLGASKWVDIHRFNRPNHDNTADCLQHLRAQGYRLVATTPHREDFPLQDLPLDQKTALLFGTEELGLSEAAMSHADAFVRIPMFGFTESFNISVSVAICLFDLVSRLHESDLPWRLREEEKLDVRLSWIQKIINRPDLLTKKFLEERGWK